MARRRRRTVFGEPVDTIRAAFRRLRVQPHDDDGLLDYEFVGITDEEAAALLRAVLRAEAVVLREEADGIRDPGWTIATAQERRGHALVLVAVRMAEVLDRQSRDRAA